MIIDFSNPWVFLIWYAITALILRYAYKHKKSKVCLIPVTYFMIILAIHAFNPDLMMNNTIHRVFNFIGIGVSLSFFVVLDEVETRRKVISQVFKNRYKKDKLPSEEVDSIDELSNKSEEKETE